MANDLRNKKMFSKNYIIPVLITTLCSMQALAGESVNKTLDVKDVKSVFIENVRGKVEIKSWSQSKVSVKGELDDQTTEFVFEQNGSAVNIKVQIPNNSKGKNYKGSDLIIHIPEESAVEFTGVSTSLVLKNLLSDSEIKTVSGDIEMDTGRGHISLSTVSGDIDAKDLDGKIYLSSVSGDVNDANSTGRINLRSVSGSIETSSTASEVSLSAVSGDIDFDLASVEEFDLSTVSGDIKGKFGLDSDGHLKMSTVSGNMSLGFIKPVDASFRLKANAGGDIVNKLTDDRTKYAKYGPGAKLNFSTGNGTASVKGTTVSGTIKLYYK